MHVHTFTAVFLKDKLHENQIILSKSGRTKASRGGLTLESGKVALYMPLTDTLSKIFSNSGIFRCGLSDNYILNNFCSVKGHHGKLRTASTNQAL